MFSIKQKRKIAQSVEDLLNELDIPELSEDKPLFQIHIAGKHPGDFTAIWPNWMADRKEKEKSNA